MENEKIELLKKVANGELTPEQADKQLLGLFIVRLPLSEYIARKEQEAWNKMGDTGNYYYASEKMNWNEENFWFGYYRALEDLEERFLEENEA